MNARLRVAVVGALGMGPIDGAVLRSGQRAAGDCSTTFSTASAAWVPSMAHFRKA